MIPLYKAVREVEDGDFTDLPGSTECTDFAFVQREAEAYQKSSGVRTRVLRIEPVWDSAGGLL